MDVFLCVWSCLNIIFSLCLLHVRCVLISQDGWTALLFAAEYDHLPVVQWLTGLGADMAAKTMVCVILTVLDCVDSASP